MIREYIKNRMRPPVPSCYCAQVEVCNTATGSVVSNVRVSEKMPKCHNMDLMDWFELKMGRTPKEPCCKFVIPTSKEE